MSNNIETLLDTYNANTLHEMAQEAGLDTTSNGKKKLRKKELIAKLLREYFTKERVLASLDRLNEQERIALRCALYDGDTHYREDADSRDSYEHAEVEQPIRGNEPV